MDLPELGIGTAFITTAVCAVCDRPCRHEDPDTTIPWPGAYVAASMHDETEVPAPVCDRCVERHYPQVVERVEAERLHYWTH